MVVGVLSNLWFLPFVILESPFWKATFSTANFQPSIPSFQSRCGANDACFLICALGLGVDFCVSFRFSVSLPPRRSNRSESIRVEAWDRLVVSSVGGGEHAAIARRLHSETTQQYTINAPRRSLRGLLFEHGDRMESALIVSIITSPFYRDLSFTIVKMQFLVS